MGQVVRENNKMNYRSDLPSKMYIYTRVNDPSTMGISDKNFIQGRTYTLTKPVNSEIASATINFCLDVVELPLMHLYARFHDSRTNSF